MVKENRRYIRSAKRRGIGAVIVSMKISTLLLLIAVGTTACVAQTDKQVGGGCEECELMFDRIPKTLSAQTTIGNSEPGAPMIIEGTIYKKDGKTPASDIILYVYHADNKGYYSNLPNEKGNKHGHLRGWMKTDASGKYKFTTIRPAAYPERNAPEHVHPLIKEKGLSVYWIDEYVFDDDPLLTKQEKDKEQKRGGSGIMHLTKGSDGVWRGKRDIILGLNIPGY